jgi:hypothetical protein
MRINILLLLIDTAVAEECGEFFLSTLDLSKIFQCDLYPDSDDPTKCVNWARGI